VSIPQFSVRQHILVNLLFFLFLLAGLVVLAALPIDFFPDISFHTASIATEWTGASADEIERLVTTKIEEEIENVAGIKEIRSRSSADVSVVEVEWNETLSDQEYSRALANLRGALERVDDLPEDAEEPRLRELSVAEVYASVVVAVVDEGGVGELALREVARDLKDRINNLAGIRRVTERGLRERELRVHVDRDAAMAADVTLLEISDVIRRNNQNLPAGSFTAGEGETTVRATGDFTSPAALAATVVKKNPDGTHIGLGEMARVEPGFGRRRLIGRYNGDPAVYLEIAKEDEADLMQMVGRLRGFVDERQAFVPEGVRLAVTQDSAPYVRERLRSLRDNLFLGLVVVIAILWFSVGFRNALLAVAGIPFSYLMAIVFFPALGITVNSISIAGMILVSGMLVDDAIIVLENVYRYVEEGLPVREAVIVGAEEVQWPVISSVLTTIAAFSPLLLMSGTSGEFMSIMPKTVIACLAASLLECLFTLPAHYIHLGSRGERKRLTAAHQRHGAVRRWSDAARRSVDRGIERFRRAYTRGLGSVLDNRPAFAALLLGLAVFAAGAAARLPVDLFAGEYSDFFIAVYGPTSYSIEQTDAVMREVEDVLAEFGPHEIRDYSTYAGMTMNPDTIPIFGPHLGVVFVSMADTRENREQPDRLLQRVKERVDGWWRANRARADNVLTMPPRNGPPLGKPVAVQIRAADYVLAKEVAREMKGFLRRVPGVFNVEDNLLPGPRELRLVMDEARASIHGLTFQELALALRGATDGIIASTFKEPGADEDIDIRVLWDERFRGNEYDLLGTEVRSPAGGRVRIGDVAEIQVDRGFLSLGHHQTRRSVIVYADVVEGVATSESVNRILMEQFGDLDVRYPGVEVVFGGEFQATAEAFADMYRVFPLAVLLIYVILAAQFRSYSQPLIVMTAVPFGIMGVVFGLLLFGYPFSFGIIYIIVGLSGVVVNDSLVLVDFINRAREGGVPLRQAVLDAGRLRLRPVLLTSLTTVGALVPTALGLFGRSLSFGPMAAAFSVGLSLATLFTLLVVPAGYYTLAQLLARRGIGVGSGDVHASEKAAAGVTQAG
jgi:HAE1 family hydrophobic/amphiphilic exporter-1